MAKPTLFSRLMGGFATLDPKSWRYKLACMVGYLLWGRPLGYLSWWPHGARSAGILLFYKGKVLVGKRRGVDTAPGKYSTTGGFVNPRETFAQGAVREVFEETGIVLLAVWFSHTNIFDIFERCIHTAVQKDFVHTAFSWIHHLTDEQAAQLLPETHEVSEFRWLDMAELEAMVAAGDMAFEHEVTRIRRAFAEGKHLP